MSGIKRMSSRTMPRWVAALNAFLRWLTEKHFWDWRYAVDSWRWKFVDDHCWCVQCEDRRAKGQQGPLKCRRPNVED